MASPVEAQLILCDHAVTDPSGKVHMLGAGWTVTTSPSAPYGVAVLMKVPWDRANQKIELHLQLLTSDGTPAGPPAVSGGEPTSIEVKAEIEVGRPPGISPGSLLPAAFALNVGSMKLPPGRYEWRLQVAENEQVSSFEVLKTPQRPV